MLPTLAVYLLWGLWALVWIIAKLMTLNGARVLRGPEELLYRLTALAAVALLFTLTPWPGFDVQYRLWERTLDNAIAWRLTAAIGAFQMLALAALILRHHLARRNARAGVDGSSALVRHFVYLCLSLAVFATATIFGRPSSFAGAALLTLAFAAKALIENRRSPALTLPAPQRAVAGRPEGVQQAPPQPEAARNAAPAPQAAVLPLSAIPLELILEDEVAVPKAAGPA